MAAADPKSPPKALRSHRALSQRAMQHSQREPEHEAFGLEPPPTKSEINAMMVITAVRSLKEFSSHADTVEQVCERCFAGQTNAKRQEAAEAGAIQAIVGCMEKHIDNEQVQAKCTLALGNITCGTDAAGLGRKQLAANSGVLPAVTAAMRSHPSSSSVQENGCATIGNVASHVDDDGIGRKAMAIEAGAIEVVVGAMTDHPAVATVQAFASFALANLTRARGEVEAATLGADSGGAARKSRAVEAGAIGAVVKAMQAFPADQSVQDHGARALANVTHRNYDLKKEAISAGADAEWLEGAVTARAATDR